MLYQICILSHYRKLVLSCRNKSTKVDSGEDSVMAVGKLH